jgi:hypothetical protein
VLSVVHRSSLFSPPFFYTTPEENIILELGKAYARARAGMMSTLKNNFVFKIFAFPGSSLLSAFSVIND